MNYVALAKLIGGAAAAVILAVALTWLVKGEVDVHHRAARLVACEGLADGKPDAKGQCPAPIASAVDGGRRQAGCDQALVGSQAKGGVPSLCTAPVQAAVAERDAGRTTIARQAQEIRAAKADTTQAVKRAVTRATTDAQRKAHADTVLERAPVGGDGLRRCDAGCLRDLAGAASGGG